MVLKNRKYYQKIENLPKYVMLAFLNSFFLIKNERGIFDKWV